MLSSRPALCSTERVDRHRGRGKEPFSVGLIVSLASILTSSNATELPCLLTALFTVALPRSRSFGMEGDDEDHLMPEEGDDRMKEEQLCI